MSTPKSSTSLRSGLRAMHVAVPEGTLSGWRIRIYGGYIISMEENRKRSKIKMAERSSRHTYLPRYVICGFKDYFNILCAIKYKTT